MKRIFRLLSVTLFLAVVICIASGAYAQSYPVKPLHVIVPFPAGGFTDVLARVIAMKLTESWGQQVLVENRPGGGGNIGTAVVAKAAPDGYTILITTSGIAINASLYSNLPYDPLKDFVPVTLLGSTPFFLMVNPSLPVKSVKDLIALAKSSKVNYGSNGIGTTTHLAAELLKSMAGLTLSISHTRAKRQHSLPYSAVRFQFFLSLFPQPCPISGRVS